MAKSPFNPANMAIPKMPTLTQVRAPGIKSPAEYAHEQLLQRIRVFQARLKDDEEMGMLLSGTVAFRVTSISHLGSMLVFVGEGEGGRAVEAYQNLSQISLTLMALPKPEGIKARRIGFESPPGAATAE